ncbi:MAG: amidophosphoribosyltransferase [Pseudomonadota bacterium]
MSTDTNPTTAHLATDRGALPLRQLTVIGIFGTDAAPRALLRMPGGQITQVAVGDTVRQGTIVAIAGTSVTLATAMSRTSQLDMPTQGQERTAA